MKYEKSNHTVLVNDDLALRSAHLSAALIYASKFHFNILPCIERGKPPLTLQGYKDATKDPVILRQWWTRWPNANIGIACGAPSGGLVVLDVDGDEGQESLRSLERTYSELPKTPLVITGKGLQFYFKSKTSFKNRVGMAPGIDLRADGGYVIAPPSIHPSGRTYVWQVDSHIDDIPIATIPEWLKLMLTPKAEELKPPKRDWTTISENVVKCGERNSTLASITGHLFRRFVDPKLAYKILWGWNLTSTEIPLSKDEFYRTINSIAKAEQKRRRRG